MKQYTDLEFLKLTRWQKFLYKLGRFFVSIPLGIAKFFVKIFDALRKGCAAVGRECADIVSTFVNGDWKTKLSFLVMGFGNLARGQILRGILFLLV